MYKNTAMDMDIINKITLIMIVNLHFFLRLLLLSLSFTKNTGLLLKKLINAVLPYFIGNSLTCEHRTHMKLAFFSSVVQQLWYRHLWPKRLHFFVVRVSLFLNRSLNPS